MQIPMERGFIKLRPRDKRPIEEWRDKQYTWDEIQPWIAQGGNYGFACGTDDIVVLDIDNRSRLEELEVGIKTPTYVVQTGSGGYHLYFKSPGAKKVIIHDKLGVHLGELQCTGQYVVCEGSIHPNGNRYEALTYNIPIHEFTSTQILAPFRGKCKLSDEAKQYTWNLVRPTLDCVDDPFANARVEDIWGAKVNSEAGGQLFCEHPCHKSSTGHNLVIKPSDGVWKCWRCNSGGGAALAYAVSRGLLDCSDARPGALRGDKFKEVLEHAYETRFIPRPQSSYSSEKVECEIDDDN